MKTNDAYKHCVCVTICVKTLININWMRRARGGVGEEGGGDQEDKNSMDQQICKK